MCRSYLGQLAGMLVRLGEIDAVAIGLLEVVTNELVGAVAAVEARAGSLVEHRPLSLRDSAVRDVADEDVMEAVQVAVVRTVDETAAFQLVQLRLGRSSRLQVLEFRVGETT